MDGQDVPDDELHDVFAVHGSQRPPSASSWSFEQIIPAQAECGSSNHRPSASIFSPAPPSIFSSGHGRPPSFNINVDTSNGSTGGTTLPESLLPSAPPTASSSAARRAMRLEDEVRATSERRRLPRAEKDADDPSTPIKARESMDRQEPTTLTTLSRLFAAQAVTSPTSSRAPSYTVAPPTTYIRSVASETATLPDHLYTRGLLGGRHSDITVVAFGHRYQLHRLILDRAPFFTSALSEPWFESTAKEIELHPEDIDPSITRSAFELALKRLYGASTAGEEEGQAIGLFAVGSWLEMQDLVDASIEAMLRQMSPETLSPLIKLVTSNYYGRAGEKIIASAKAMLCRDGWRMPLKFWDGIPGDIVREIVGGDGFFIDGEWNRWVLAKRLLDRRLKARAVEAGLLDPNAKSTRILRIPDTVNLMAVRFDAVYRNNSVSTGRGTPDSHYRWIALYTNPDIEPLLVLLDEGIHYIHLDFEQLQFIRKARDAMGLPVMPEKVINNALWMGMELRQKVVNSREQDMELGLSRKAEDTSAPKSERSYSRYSAVLGSSPSSDNSPVPSKGKQKAVLVENAIDETDQDDFESGSWDANGKPRKFWIPSTDCNIVMGGNAEPVVTTSTAFQQRQASRLSATLQPEDVQWATDFSGLAATSEQRHTAPARPGSAGEREPKAIAYTHYPPFRFAAEFPNPRLLKEKKRVYSRTVFYAGSLWNIYIQKVRSSKNPQLGVYLHRAKERETEEVIAGTAGLAQGSVDERIGQLEQQLLLRSERRARRQQRNSLDTANHDADAGDTSGSGGDPDATLVSTGSSSARVSASTMRNILARGHRKSSQTDLSTSVGSTQEYPYEDGTDPPSDAEYSSDDDSEFGPATRRFHTPALPPYIDNRPTIKTYFKIYSPSKGGRMLSVYESAPDQFNFSQSWGWKSSSLCLDEGLLGGGGGGAGGDGGEGTGEVKEASGTDAQGRREGKLRFMVVIGNV